MNLSALVVVAVLGQPGPQNVKPQIGYVYPPSARAGTSVEVRLGTYDWTSDVELFTHDPRLKIEILGPAGEPILTPPPYWFGAKAGTVQPPLPSEVPARITIAPDCPPGPIKWQVANANGGSEPGLFVVEAAPTVVEPEKSKAPLELPTLPAVAVGRMSRITEIDQVRFTAPAAGLITCRLDDRVGRPFEGVLTVRDGAGRVVADAADTVGRGALVTFAAEKGAVYTASIHDADHAGDRGFVYRLTVEQGPRIVASVPTVLPRGAKTSVELIGWGVASGAWKLESVTQTVDVPKTAGDTFRAEFKLPHGAASFDFPLADSADAVEAPTAKGASSTPPTLAVPSRTSAVLDLLDEASQMALDRYRIDLKKGDAVRLAVEAARFDSPVDPSLAVIDSEGKELIRGDDLPTSTDAAVDFTAPADGTYEVVVNDYSGTVPSRAHTYRLLVDRTAELVEFDLTVPAKLDIHLGDKADLLAKLVRRGSWQDPIDVSFENLPAGVAEVIEEPPPPPAPPVKGKKPVAVKPAVRKPKLGPGDQRIPLTAAADAATASSMVTVVAKATVGDRTIERRERLLVTTTLKPRVVVKSAVQDGGRIVNRGTTYPADVIVERLEGYTGPVTLRMASVQQRQRRGIRGETMTVPAGVDTVQYPVFMPEWLETSLTARINVIGVTEVADPKGKKRQVIGAMDGLIVMSLEGALLKLSHEPAERSVAPGGVIDIPVKVSRTVRIPEPAKVELVPDEDDPSLFSAEVLTLAPAQSSAVVRVRVSADPKAAGPRTIKLRATALEKGKWPAVSETSVPVVVETPKAVAGR